MNELRGGIVDDDAERKRVIVYDALVNLMGVVIGQFNLETSLMDDLEKLGEKPRTLPNFIGLDEAAQRHGVNFTPDLAALLAVLCLRQWYDFGAGGLSDASYMSFDKLDGEPQQIELLRLCLNACSQLAYYHLGDETDRDPASEAFRLLGYELLERDSERAVGCALNACNLAVDGTVVVAAADALINIARQHNEDAARLGLTYRARGLHRRWLAESATKLDLFDAFEAACRYSPAGSTKELAGSILGRFGNEVEFLRPHFFLWKCVFDPDSVDTDLRFACSYAEPVWHIDDSVLMRVLSVIQVAVAEVENRRLELLPHDKDAVAVADLNRWSIDYRAFRQAIPFASSLLREENWSDILLTLGHEIIHIESAQGWLGLNLHALRIAATEYEFCLLHMAGELSAQADDARGPSFHLATLTDEHLFGLALVEQQLELVRKSQLLRAIWLPWLEGIAVFGELSADPLLDSERSTAFSDVVTSLNDVALAEVARERGLSIEDASRAIRADAEKLCHHALTDSGGARLRTYLDKGPEIRRYLAGYLAARAVLSSWRRSQPFNGLAGYQGLISVTTAGTRSAVPNLTLPPREFEARARAEMLDWLRRISALDESSVATLATAPRWEWVTGGSQDRVVAKDRDDTDPLAEIAALAKSARVPRTGRAGEFDELGPEHAASISHVLDGVAEHLPQANEPLVNVLVDYLNDHISLVPIGHVTAPFWLSLGGEVPQLVVGIRVTETDREHGRPSYGGYVVPLTPEKLSQLQEQMQLLHSARMEVWRYADTAQYIAGKDQGRGLGRNVLGLVYGEFTLVLPAGQFTGSSASPSLTRSVENRLRPPSLIELDTTVVTGAAIARRAIEWIESGDFPRDLDVGPEMDAWTERVLALARDVLKDDDVQLVTEVSDLILTRLGWDGGEFARVCESGLLALYDEDSPALGPLLDAAMVSGAGVSEADVDDIPENVKSLLFEATGHGYDFRRFRGASP